MLGILALNLANSWAQPAFVDSATVWAEGYPKLHFGSQLLSGSEVFPQRFGGMPSKGGIAQDLILRLNSSRHLSDPSFTVALSGFGGGDNSWSLNSTSIACYTVRSDGAILPQDDCFRGLAAQWEHVPGSLTINLKQMTVATDYAIKISALSISGGKGPLPPSCLRKDSPIYISHASSGDQQLPKVRLVLVNILRSTFSQENNPPSHLFSQMLGSMASVAPIGCARGAEMQVLSMGVAKNDFLVASIGQNDAINSIGGLQTFTVTLVRCEPTKYTQSEHTIKLDVMYLCS